MTNLALIYVRSVRDDPPSGVEAQERACRELTDVQASDEIVVYSDREVSALDYEQRTGWRALCNRLNETSADDVVVLAMRDQSRAARGHSGIAEFLTLLEGKPWVRVVFSDAEVDPGGTPRTPR